MRQRRSRAVFPPLRQNIPIDGNGMPATPPHRSREGGGSRLSDAVSRLNDYIQTINRNIEFTVNEDLNRVIVKVYNLETAEVIREIPAEEVLDLSDHLVVRMDWVRDLGF